MWLLIYVVADLCKQLLRWSLYTLAEYFTYVKYLPLWYLSTDRLLVKVWGFIILKRQLIIKSELSVGHNQTFFLLKSLTSSLVLVRVYLLDNKGSSSCSLVLVRIYWLDDKGAPLKYHQVWWQRADTSKLSVLAKVLTRWLGSWQVMRDNQTWRWTHLEWFGKQLKTWLDRLEIRIKTRHSWTILRLR